MFIVQFGTTGLISIYSLLVYSNGNIRIYILYSYPIFDTIMVKICSCNEMIIKLTVGITSDGLTERIVGTRTNNLYVFPIRVKYCNRACASGI